MPPIEPTASGIRIRLQVQPRSGRTELAGRLGEVLKIRVTAAPVGGAANAELIRFLAETLGVARGAVTLKAGSTGRKKIVEVAGLSPTQAAARLNLPP